MTTNDNGATSIRAIEQSRNRAIAIIIALWAISTIFWLTPGITKPDGAGYFVYLPSTYFDRDLLFFDEWQELGMVPRGRILHKEITATDHLANHWTVGSAMLWFPAFTLGDLTRAIPALANFPRNGISLPYNVPVALTSAVAGLLTLLTGYHVSRRFASPFGALTASIAIWFGSTLMWYSLRQSIMSHAIAAMSCAIALAAALRLRDRSDYGAWIAAGLAGGLVFAVRPQNAPVMLLPFFFAAALTVSRLVAYAAAALVAASPQFIVSSYIYGNPLAFLWGAEARPFAAGDRVWWWEPILSWYHGLIPWTPIAAIGIAGIVLLWKIDRRLALACGMLFAAQWIINATLERSFWGASAFGQRRFDGCTIIFLIGSAILFARVPRWVAVLIAMVCCAWTMSIFFAASSGLDLAAYHTPAELWREQVRGLGTVPDQLRFLEAVPPVAKASVAILMGVTASLLALTYLLVRRLPGVAAAYFAVMIVWFASSGSTRQLPRYDQLLAANRIFSRLPGGADIRIGLLGDELRYLRKSGREELARQTEAELQALIKARREAQERLLSR